MSDFFEEFVKGASRQFKNMHQQHRPFQDDKSRAMLDKAQREGLPVQVVGEWPIPAMNEELSEFSGIIVHGTCEEVTHES